LLDLRGWYKTIGAGEWKKLLLEDISKIELARIRNNTHTGRPLGSDSFISKLERKIGCRLRPLPVGRPKRKKGQQK
jgi:putative transposase